MSKQYVAITLTLRFPGPVSVADVSAATIEARARQVQDKDQREPDILVAQDHQGRPVLRGTTVMGCLRAHLDRFEVSGQRTSLRGISSTGQKQQTSRAVTLADLVAGAAPEEIDDKGRVTRSSALRVLTCDLATTEADDGPKRVAINRSRGAAEVSKLFQRQELPAGAKADVVLRFDPALAREASEGLTEGLLAALQQWSPQVGGLTSTGYGHARVEHLKWGRIDLGTDDGLAALFGAKDTVGLYRDAARKPVKAVLPGWLTAPEPRTAEVLNVTFQLQDSLLISPEPVARNGRDVAVTLKRAGEYVIPASAWKGVLRSRAEYILRSAGVPACESTTALCCVCPTCNLFGCTPEKGSSLAGNRSLLEFTDSQFSADSQERVRIAVDRFSGGAADKKLFTQEVAVAPAKIPLKINPLGDVPPWAGPLLMMVVRDLHDGLIGIGARSNRGAGTLRLASEPDVSGWPAALAALRKLKGAS